MINENPASPAGRRVSKYFLYAVGEIILVVIGILIAININSYVESRNNILKEEKYVKLFQQDIQNIRADLSQLQPRLQNVYNACDTLIRVIHSPDSVTSRNSLNWQTDEMIKIPSIDINFQSYQNLKNTSDFNLIQNDSLKRALSKVEFAINQLLLAYAWQDKQWTDINQIYVNKNLDLVELSKFAEPAIYKAGVTSVFKNDWAKILKDPEFSNVVLNRKWAVIDIFRATENLNKVFDSALKLIHQEME